MREVFIVKHAIATVLGDSLQTWAKRSQGDARAIMHFTTLKEPAGSSGTPLR
jgi:hypothetical protein